MYKEHIEVDEEDRYLLDKYCWSCSKRGRTVYVSRMGGKKLLLLHRVVLGIKDSRFVDHIDGNGLNNKKSNLRVCTHKQNIRNRRLNKDNTSGFKGVWFMKNKSKKSKKWMSQITVDGQRFYCAFKTKIEAAAYYNEMAKSFFGEFAKLNEI